MKYFWAVVFPPITLLLCGKWGQVFLNMFLCCLGWMPGIIHAVCVAFNHDAEQRFRRLNGVGPIYHPRRYY